MESRMSNAPDTNIPQTRYYGLHIAAPSDRKPEAKQEVVKMRPYEEIGMIVGYLAFLAIGYAVWAVVTHLLTVWGVELLFAGVVGGLVASAAAILSFRSIFALSMKLDWEQRKKAGFPNVM